MREKQSRKSNQYWNFNLILRKWKTRQMYNNKDMCLRKNQFSPKQKRDASNEAIIDALKSDTHTLWAISQSKSKEKRSAPNRFS